MPHLLDPLLVKTFERDRKRLAKTELPIVTLSATFREDVKRLYGLPDDDTLPDIVLSRAHFSMALGVAMQAWHGKIDSKKAWLADPTNYVSAEDWKSITLTETIGKTLARHKFLKLVKDLADRFGRSKLPILDSITPPLLYLTESITKPILCFHIAAGNILIEQGKTVVQVITDPHVRPEYVTYAANPRMTFCVFDERVKTEFMEVAGLRGIAADPKRVYVTGPPIDPRIVAAKNKKKVWEPGRPIRLCLSTGGLGTNKTELHQLLMQLLPELYHDPLPYQILFYAGTQRDIAVMADEVARQHHIKPKNIDDAAAPFRVLYHPQILDANELLIKYAFPWADGFMTKPSGDMAYDAAAAGSFLLTLQEWGVWEERVREVFEQKNIARRAEVSQIVKQLKVLSDNQDGTNWITTAMNHAQSIEKLFLLGSKKIVELTTSLSD